MEFIEQECSGQSFRIMKERSLLGQGILEKIWTREGTIGVHDVIKVDYEIFDREKRQWRKITNEDLDSIPSSKGIEIYNKIMELRKVEKDFQKVQPKKPKEKSGS